MWSGIKVKIFKMSDILKNYTNKNSGITKVFVVSASLELNV